MEIFKGANAGGGCVIGREDLELINALARRELKEEEVYTFSVRLCDNEIDREWERFDRETLEELAKLFVGKSGIFDHDWSARGQAARIYKAQVVDEPGRVTGAGDRACYLKGWAYMLRTEGNRDLIAEIEGGIKKEVSVGCAVEKALCSVCGQEMGTCRHEKGKHYGGKLCFARLTGAKDAYEWSFVAVPAQPRAGVIKAMAPTLKALAATSPQAGEELAELEKAAGLGRRYLDQLRREVARLAGLKAPEMEMDVIRSITGKLEEDELVAVRDHLKREKGLQAAPQLTYPGGRHGEREEDGAFLV